MTITSLELKVLTQLLAQGGRCNTLADLDMGGRTSMPQQVRICRQLSDQGLITHREAIVRFGLTVIGKTLLRLDASVWPVTPDQLLILRSCARGRIGPGQIHYRVPVAERQRLLQGLAEQGLVVVYGQEVVELRLTDLGQAYLASRGRSSMTENR
ncbi:MAG: hypothetical protein ACFCVD_06700 [Nodosilinea sp.]